MEPSEFGPTTITKHPRNHDENPQARIFSINKPRTSHNPLRPTSQNPQFKLLHSTSFLLHCFPPPSFSTLDPANDTSFCSERPFLHTRLPAFHSHFPPPTSPARSKRECSWRVIGNSSAVINKPATDVDRLFSEERCRCSRAVVCRCFYPSRACQCGIARSLDDGCRRSSSGWRLHLTRLDERGRL
jgi:hypothetical protein